MYIAGRDQGERGTDDRAEQGGTRKGVGAVGAWRVLAALAALAPIASPRPAGQAPELIWSSIYCLINANCGNLTVCVGI